MCVHGTDERFYLRAWFIHQAATPIGFCSFRFDFAIKNAEELTPADVDEEVAMCCFPTAQPILFDIVSLDGRSFTLLKSTWMSAHAATVWASTCCR